MVGWATERAVVGGTEEEGLDSEAAWTRGVGIVAGGRRREGNGSAVALSACHDNQCQPAGSAVGIGHKVGGLKAVLFQQG